MKTPASILLIISLLGLIIFGIASADTIHTQFFSSTDSFGKAELMQECRKRGENGPGAVETCTLIVERAASEYRQGQRLYLATELLLCLIQLLHTISLVAFLRNGSVKHLRRSAIWSSIPGTSPGLVLGIPFGIWALFSLKRNSRVIVSNPES